MAKRFMGLKQRERVATSAPAVTAPAVTSSNKGVFASMWDSTKSAFSSAKASIGTAFAATGSFIAANWGMIAIAVVLIAVVVGIAYYNGFFDKAADAGKAVWNNIKDKLSEYAAEISGKGETFSFEVDPEKAADLKAVFAKEGITKGNYLDKCKGNDELLEVAKSTFTFRAE